MEIKTTSRFRKSFKQLLKKDRQLIAEYEDMLSLLNQNPSTGTLLSDSVYKIRLKNRSNNKGKSAGYRVISYTKIEDTVLLVDIYSKSNTDTIKDEKIDTSSDEIVDKPIENTKNKEVKLDVISEITEQPFDEIEELIFPNDDVKNDVKDVGARKTPTLEEELKDTIAVDIAMDLFEKVPQKNH